MPQQLMIPSDGLFLRTLLRKLLLCAFALLAAAAAEAASSVTLNVSGIYSTTKSYDPDTFYSEETSKVNISRPILSSTSVKFTQSGVTTFTGNNVVGTISYFDGASTVTLTADVSRPVKVTGVVKGFYAWIDNSPTSGSGSGGAEDRAFILSLDNSYFNGLASPYQVSSSSDRVDSALNAALTGAPVGVNDTGYTAPNTTLTVAAASGVLSNDSSNDPSTLRVVSFTVSGDVTVYTAGSTATITAAGPVTVGTLVINANGSYTFVPDAAFTGTAPVVTYKLNDITNTSPDPTATLTLTVASNNPPQGGKTGSSTYDTAHGYSSGNSRYEITTAEDTLYSGSVTAYDADSDSLTYTKATDPSHGTVSVNTDGTYSYRPDSNYTGNDSFTITVSDGKGGTATITVYITVTPVNDPPVGGKLADGSDDPNYNTTNSRYEITTPEDTAYSGQVKAYDVEGDTLTYTKATNPSHGTVTVNTNGTYTYTPTANYTGNDSFTITVSDGHGGTATITVYITVTPVNDPPVGGKLADGSDDPNYNTASGRYENTTVLNTPVSGRVRAYDVEGDTLTFTKGSNPAHGTVVVNSDGTYTYTPATGYVGADSFTVTVSDGHGGTTTITVYITVYAPPVNTVPTGDMTFSGDPARVIGPNGSTFAVTDADSPILSVRLTAGHGYLTLPVQTGLTFLEGNGTNNRTVLFRGTLAALNAALSQLLYQPQSGYFGPDTITIVSTDERSLTDTDRIDPPFQVRLNTLGGTNDGISLSTVANENKVLTSAAVTSFDSSVIRSASITGTGSNSRLAIGTPSRQDGSVQYTSVNVRLTYSDGSSEVVQVLVTIYNPKLNIVTQLRLNPQTSLYEQRVQVSNTTPFTVDSFRIIIPTLPAGVSLYSRSTTTADGRAAIDDVRPMASGEVRVFYIEYFAPNVQTFTEPALILELNSASAPASPVGTVKPVDRVVAGFNGKQYVEFSTLAGKVYWVQYRDSATGIWQTSPVAINGTGLSIHWLDDGWPMTLAAPGSTREYRLVETNASGAALVITAQPASMTVAAGTSVTLGVTMSSAGPFTYQWYRDGVALTGATNSTLTIAKAALTDEGDYYVAISNGSASINSSTARVSLSSTNPGRMLAISVRGQLPADNSPLITGISLSGTGTRTVLMRSVGEALRGYGVAAAVTDPKLTLYRGSTALANNDSWSLDPDAAASADAANHSGAAPLRAGSADAALTRSLTTGSYTLWNTKASGTGSIVLSEIYDAAPSYDSQNGITGLSARAQVGAGDNVLIAGVVITGNTTCRLIARAVGPGLAAQGVAGFLDDPELLLYPAGSGTPVAVNDDWSAVEPIINAEQLFTKTGMASLTVGSKDAVIVTRVTPGIYTLVARGKGAASGQTMIEVYLIP